MNTNYFAVTDDGVTEHIFFDGLKFNDTVVAFAEALISADDDMSKISMYCLPWNAGQWDRCGLVGFRRRGEILGDIDGEENPDTLALRKLELAALEAQYVNAGRESLPLVEVEVANAAA